MVAIVLNVGLFALLLGYTIVQGQVGTWVTLLATIVVAFVAEWIIRARTGRHLKVTDAGTGGWTAPTTPSA